MMYRLVTVLVVIGVIAGGCSFSDEPEARTYYESLDLSAPDATIETFVGAFNDDDFMTVWLTLDWHAQQEINNAFNLLQLSSLVDTSKIPDPGVTITDPVTDLIGRGNLDRWRVFDELMLVADEYDAFLIDMGELSSATPIGSIDDGSASVAVTFHDRDDEVIFNLSQGEEGRWFVHQVVALGGDTDQVPWASQPSAG